jgi:protein O-GlcNAc transferase
MSAAEEQQLRQLAQLHPGDAAIRRRLGNVLQGLGDLRGAERAYRESLVRDPANVRAHNNLGQVLQALGDPSGAMFSYQRAIAIDGRYAIAHNNLGILHFDQGRHDEALGCYQQALSCEPNFVQALHNCGNTLLKLQRPEEALAHYDRAVIFAPRSVETLNARGNALQQLERFEDALDSYDEAIAIEPRHAEALSNSASVLLALKRPEEALRRSELALSIMPQMAAAISNYAGALRSLNRLVEAREACERALQLQPQFAQAWSNLANVLTALGFAQDAVECCDKAIALQPDLLVAYERKALALPREKRIDDVIRAYEVMQRLKPDHEYLAGALDGARKQACDWRGSEQSRQELEQAVAQGRAAISPFILLSSSDSPALQLRCARDFAAREILPAAPAERLAPHQCHTRLRVAYLSADFHNHATAMLMAGVFEAHDRKNFEIIAVSFGPDQDSPMRQRLRLAFDRFLDVRLTGDIELVAMLREMEIDIAVDLKGYTGEMRPGLFARRCAPVQVSYLGYPGTLGLPQMDYIIADRVVLPPEHAQFCSEKIVWMPDSYQCNDDKRVIGDRSPTRADAGLPDSAFVFCCFNNNYKITPAVFDVWMQLLLAIPGSVLWLLGDNEAAVRNLRNAAANRGVEPSRLVFAARTDSADHLARHHLADLFLDTLPYNAHTTASDALWAGLPVLTCRGNAFAGRVGASLLNAVGLPELITTSSEEYAARALELARDPAQLSALRARLAINRRTQPLFDTTRFCRHLEAAYSGMWDRHKQAIAPESFEVSAC